MDSGNFTKQQAEAALRKYFTEKRKLMQISSGKAPGGVVVSVSVNKAQLIRVLKKTREEAETEAILRTWSKVITLSKETEQSFISKYLPRPPPVQSPQKPTPTPLVSRLPKEYTSPWGGSTAVDQSIVTESSYMETDPDECDRSGDQLLQTTIMARKLHRSLAEVSQSRLQKGGLHRKTGTKSEFVTNSASFDVPKTARCCGVSGVKPAGVYPSTPGHKSYRSLADARFEAKTRLKLAIAS